MIGVLFLYTDENPPWYERSQDILLSIGGLFADAIVDKNCRIGKAVRIVNDSKIEDSDPANAQCVIRDGIACIIKGVSLPDGWDLKASVTELPDA